MNAAKNKQNNMNNTNLNLNNQFEETNLKTREKLCRKFFKLKEEDLHNSKLVKNFIPLYYPEEFFPEWPSGEEINVLKYFD